MGTEVKRSFVSLKTGETMKAVERGSAVERRNLVVKETGRTARAMSWSRL